MNIKTQLTITIFYEVVFTSDPQTAAVLANQTFSIRKNPKPLKLNEGATVETEG